MLFATFIITIFDIYILRTRHWILEKYYPERRRPRAAWLYNHILRRRGTTLREMFHYVQDLLNRTSNPSVMIDFLADRYSIFVRRANYC
jgi:DC-STAMP-like protein